MGLEHIIIIGNGIAGVTAARHIRKASGAKITIISAESQFFYSRTALMYVYMGHMKFEHTQPYENHFWKNNKIELLQDEVLEVDFSNKLLKLKNSSSPLSYSKLILATGSKPNFLPHLNQKYSNLQGLYAKQDLEKLEDITNIINNATVIGGGLIGVELAEMLHSRGKKVTMLVREKSFWDLVLPKEESQLINHIILKHGIDLRFETEVTEVKADENNVIEALKLNNDEEIKTDFVGLCIGVSPNVDFLKNSAVEINRGVLVNEYLETSVKDVYAIGDCAEKRIAMPSRKNIEQIWYTGRIMGETLAKTLTGYPTKYQPGVFFNSAKFFDLEYQTYGTLEALKPDFAEDIFWQNTEVEKLVRIRYHKVEGHVLGVNCMGLRMRHEVWDKWISEKISLSEVMNNLEKANFDPEFFKSYEADIQKIYVQKTGNNLIKKKKFLWF